MKTRNATLQDQTPRWARGVAWLGIAAFAILLWLSSSEAAHREVHSDCDDAGHSCAVTHWAQGTVAVAVTTLVVLVSWIQEEVRRAAAARRVEFRSQHWPWAQGPPVLV